MIVTPLSIAAAVLTVLSVALLLALGKCATELDEANKRIGRALDDRDRAVEGNKLLKAELARAILQRNVACQRANILGRQVELLETCAAAWGLEAHRLRTEIHNGDTTQWGTVTDPHFFTIHTDHLDA